MSSKQLNFPPPNIESTQIIYRNKGVHQGSIVGPVLYVIYNNDLVYWATGKYAVDIYYTYSTSTYCITAIITADQIIH